MDFIFSYRSYETHSPLLRRPSDYERQQTGGGAASTSSTINSNDGGNLASAEMVGGIVRRPRSVSEKRCQFSQRFQWSIETKSEGEEEVKEVEERTDSPRVLPGVQVMDNFTAAARYVVPILSIWGTHEVFSM